MGKMKAIATRAIDKEDFLENLMDKTVTGIRFINPTGTLSTRYDFSATVVNVSERPGEDTLVELSNGWQIPGETMYEGNDFLYEHLETSQ